MCQSNTTDTVCGRSIVEVQRRLSLHPNCKKQQYAHLVETEAQIQTVKFWEVEALHRRLHLTQLDDKAKSIALPKIHDSTYRLLLGLTKTRVLPTIINSQGAKVIYPPWTQAWTRPEWDLDTSEAAGWALLARCSDSSQVAARPTEQGVVRPDHQQAQYTRPHGETDPPPRPASPTASRADVTGGPNSEQHLEPKSHDRPSHEGFLDRPGPGGQNGGRVVEHEIRTGGTATIEPGRADPEEEPIRSSRPRPVMSYGRALFKAQDLFENETMGLLREQQALDAVNPTLFSPIYVQELRMRSIDIEARKAAVYEHAGEINRLLRSLILGRL
ncbi:hypothetical protein JX266_006481 [Neoarthrinium moseri]|nr:hypothetical protein JX266_006481 [Neoarthrinium moseri]